VIATLLSTYKEQSDKFKSPSAILLGRRITRLSVSRAHKHPRTIDLCDKSWSLAEVRSSRGSIIGYETITVYDSLSYTVKKSIRLQLTRHSFTKRTLNSRSNEQTEATKQCN
jgi:hypothetical protein